jgi:hypothetical protein
MRICVYAASSPQCDPRYKAAAAELGRLIAEAGATLVYGGGANGLMGAAADGAIAAGGKVIGIIPRFMTEVEWQHPGVADLQIVEDMRERKHRLLTDSDAVVALPGGCGTLEELFEAITLKRLGIYFSPIVLLNTLDFWAPLHRFMADQVIAQKFMNPEHLDMWSLVNTPQEVLPRIRTTPRWREDARSFAVPR